MALRASGSDPLALRSVAVLLVGELVKAVDVVLDVLRQGPPVIPDSNTPIVLRGDKRVWTPVGLACNCPLCRPAAHRAWKRRQKAKR